MSDLPRVLFCCFDVVPAPHATSRRLTEYLEGLVDRYQTVVLSVKTPDHSHIERYHGARLLRVPVGSGDLRSQMEAFDRAVRRQLESEEYVLVHFFDPAGGYPLCERRAELGFKLVYDASRFPSSDLPSIQPQEGSNKRLLARSRRQELFCLMNADAVIVGSETAKSHVEGLGVPPGHVNVIRAPVDLTPYLPALMGTPTGSPPRLIHLGSHGLHQDLPLLFQALTKTLEPMKLALVGPSSPELTPALKAQAAELGLLERVEFQEPVAHDDLHKVIATADIGVLTLSDDPRNEQSTALARLGEYLAGGRPVVCADNRLTRELLTPEVAQFYRPGDLPSLVAALDALADPDRRLAMGSAARQAASAVDSKLVRERLVELYRRTVPLAQAPSDGVLNTGPNEATQMGGRPPDGAGDVTQASARIRAADLGTHKIKTDPAVQGPGPEAETGTDAAVARGRPPVMGVLIRGEVAPEVTDPNLPDSAPSPIVMGQPLSESMGRVDAQLPPEAPTIAVGGALDLAAEPRTETQHAGALPRASPRPPESPPEAVAVTAPTLLNDLPPSPDTTAPAPPPAFSAPPPAPRLGAHDDEPLDFSALLKPSAPVAVGALPEAPAPQVPAPRPPPIPVPTSFSFSRRASSPSGVLTAPTAPTAPPLPPPLPPPLSTSASGLRAAPPPLPQPSQASAPRPLPSSPSGLTVATSPPARVPPAPSALTLQVTQPQPAWVPPQPEAAARPASAPPSSAPERGPHESIVEVLDDELEVVSDEHPAPGGEPDDVEVHEGVEAIETSAAPPPSKLDPWFAQLVHGYCPPQSQLFNRHVPPTTMPGKNT